MKSKHSSPLNRKDGFISKGIAAPQWLVTFLSLLTVFSFSGCSILIGRVDPVESHATSDNHRDLPEMHPDWKPLDARSVYSGTPHENLEIPDQAWQSTRTAAIISLNSACRASDDPYQPQSVKQVTRTLLSPWRSLKISKQEETQVSGFPALETHAQGNYLGRPRKFQLVVVKTQACTYDLLYLSTVATFADDLDVFLSFRDNLKLK